MLYPWTVLRRQYNVRKALENEQTADGDPVPQGWLALRDDAFVIWGAKTKREAIAACNGHKAGIALMAEQF